LFSVEGRNQSLLLFIRSPEWVLGWSSGLLYGYYFEQFARRQSNQQCRAKKIERLTIAKIIDFRKTEKLVKHCKNFAKTSDKYGNIRDN
jgi:hypothetical protein